MEGQNVAREMSKKTFPSEAGIGCGIMSNPCTQKKKKKFVRKVILLSLVRAADLYTIYDNYN
jgi:hypothetical protein